MSKPKSIFIVDTPESINGEPPCYYCPLYQTDSDYYYQSYICQNITNEIEDNDNNMWEIYKNCPLKPYQKAIPIEWIKNIINTNIYLWEQNKEKMFVDQGVVKVVNYSITAQILSELIDRWEKENEHK